MPGTVQALQKELIAQITPQLAEMGFAFKAKTRSFYRDIKGGKQILHLTFINHPGDFDVTADVAVRIDALEDLVNAGNQTISASERALTASVGAELGNISAGQPKRWKVASEADVAHAVSGVLGEFRSTGLPYLERFCSLEEIMSVLAGDDPASRLHSPLHTPRAMRALGAAFLLGRWDRFDEIAETKSRYLAERKDFGLGTYTAFAERLAQKKPA